MSDTQKRSSIWLQFKDNGNSKAGCVHCKMNITLRAGSTTNLHRHMRTVHPTVQLEERGQASAPSTDPGVSHPHKTATAAASTGFPRHARITFPTATQSKDASVLPMICGGRFVFILEKFETGSYLLLPDAANMASDTDECKYFVREIEKNDGGVIKVKQCYFGDVGCVVWDAAIVLAKYLETQQFYDLSSGVNVWAGKRVVDLGAGTGVVGLMAATLGAQVTVTDLEDLQSLLRVNIQQNQALISSGSITAKVLKWGEDVSEVLPPPHFVLLADCIYYEQSIVPLVETLKLLSGQDTCIICCYEQRTEGVNPKVERQFFELLQKNFNCEEITSDKQDPEFSSPDIHILHIKKKRLSFCEYQIIC